MMVLAPWMEMAIVVAAGLGLAGGVFAIEAALLRGLRKSAESTPGKWDDVVVKAVHPALPLGAAALCFAAALQAAKPILSPGAQAWTHGVLAVSLALLAAVALSRILHAVIARHVARHPQRAALGNILFRMIQGALLVIALLTAMDQIGVEVTPLVASLGITGVALALALQDSLSNFFAGLWMRSTRDLRPGHTIRIDDEYEGLVTAIGWRTTRLRTRANNLVIVPNGQLSKSTVTNFSLPDPRTRIAVSVVVGLETDEEKARAALTAVAEEAAASDGFVAEPGPTVRLDPGFIDRGLAYTVRCNVRDPSRMRAGEDELRRRIAARLRADGIRLS